MSLLPPILSTAPPYFPSNTLSKLCVLTRPVSAEHRNSQHLSTRDSCSSYASKGSLLWSKHIQCTNPYAVPTWSCLPEPNPGRYNKCASSTHTLCYIFFSSAWLVMVPSLYTKSHLFHLHSMGFVYGDTLKRLVLILWNIHPCIQIYSIYIERERDLLAFDVVPHLHIYYTRPPFRPCKR